jgi:hypothetical protein
VWVIRKWVLLVILAITSLSSEGVAFGAGAFAASAGIRSVNWKSVRVPGAVCGNPRPIQLHSGKAKIPTPPGVSAGTPEVWIFASAPHYGDLFGPGHDIAALNVWCDNTGGTADGQVQNSWVIYSMSAGRLRTIGTLTPQQPSTKDTHIPYFDGRPGGFKIKLKTITAKEIWYGSEDGTCCPSGRATTIWTYAHGAFTPKTTSLHNPRGNQSGS